MSWICIKLRRYFSIRNVIWKLLNYKYFFCSKEWVNQWKIYCRNIYQWNLIWYVVSTHGIWPKFHLTIVNKFMSIFHGNSTLTFLPKSGGFWQNVHAIWTIYRGFLKKFYMKSKWLQYDLNCTHLSFHWAFNTDQFDWFLDKF